MAFPTGVTSDCQGTFPVTPGTPYQLTSQHYLWLAPGNGQPFGPHGGTCYANQLSDELNWGDYIVDPPWSSVLINYDSWAGPGQTLENFVSKGLTDTEVQGPFETGDTDDGCKDLSETIPQPGGNYPGVWEIATTNATFTAIKVCTTNDPICTASAEFFQTQHYQFESNLSDLQSVVGQSADTLDWCILTSPSTCASVGNDTPVGSLVNGSQMLSIPNTASNTEIFFAPANSDDLSPGALVVEYLCAEDHLQPNNYGCAKIYVADLGIYLNPSPMEPVSVPSGQSQIFQAAINPDVTLNPAGQLIAAPGLSYYLTWPTWNITAPPSTCSPATTTTTTNTLSTSTFTYCAPPASNYPNATISVIAQINMPSGGPVSLSAEESFNVGANYTAQTVSFGTIPAQTATATLELTATASSGLPVTFYSTTPGISTVVGNTVTFSGAGTASITAEQPGNATYAAASSSQSFTVNFATQSVTFAAIPTQQLAAATLMLTATASSGLPVSFTSTTPTVCTVSGSTASLLASGTCTIQANQVGNPAYSPASVVTQSFTVSPATGTLPLIIPAAGIAGTMAGNGTQGYLGDGGQAPSAELNSPTGVAVDSAGNLYIADSSNNVIRMVSASTGIITTVAGNGTAGYSGDGSSAINAQLNGPVGIAADPAGNIYIADQGNCAIRKVTASTGVITTVAGVANNPWGGYSGDNGPATNAALSFPNSVSLDASGNLYIADQYNGVIRKVAASTGVITTVVGNGSMGYSGDGGLAASAELNFPSDVRVDSAGNIFIADYNNEVIREVAASTGIITTVAGNGTLGYSGDGGPATSAMFVFPAFLALDSAGNIYVSDSGNEVIRKVTASTGIITTIVGNGTAGYSGDGNLSTAAELNSPAGVTVAPAGTFYSTNNLYFADSSNNVVRAVGGYRTAAPIFSPISATYATTQNVTVSDSISGTTIYYTTDGTTPTTSSQVYSGPIAVSSTETLNAIAVTSTGLFSAVGTASYTITQVTPTVNFASGFTSTNLSLINDASIVDGALQLSDGSSGEERAAWFNTPVSSQAFTTDFNYQATSAVADGITFTLQNDPTGFNALGDGGGGLGYGGIESSVAIKLDLYSNTGEGTDSTGVYTNGTLPYLPALDMTASGVILRSGDLMHVHITYDGAALTWTITDTVTNANYTASTAINIRLIVGGNTAYAGFTSATGAFSSVQNVSNWTFFQ